MFKPIMSSIAVAAALTALILPASAQTSQPQKPQPTATQPMQPATPAAPAKAKPAAPATAQTPATTSPAKPPSEAQLAARARMKDCGAQWQKAKAANTTGGKTWRQFSSTCLKQN